MENQICLTIISQQVLFKNGLSYILANDSNIRIVESGNRNNKIERVLETASLDVVIVDYDISSELCLDLTRRIKQRLPHIGVIIFSSKVNDEALFTFLNARASAYLSKEASAAEIINTIKVVAGGGYPINESLQTNPRVSELVLRKFQELGKASTTHRIVSPLTDREAEVLQLTANGYSYKQITARLEINEHAIENHITSILRKLDANARAEALVIGVQQGIITVD